VLTAAMDESSLRAALEFMRRYEAGLSAVRYPRDQVDDRFAGAECPPFELGRARALVEESRPDIAVFGYGMMALHALDARAKLDGERGEYRISVYDARFAKPVDIDLIRSLVERGVPILTVEDHGLPGGFGASVIEACNDAGLRTDAIHRLGIPERWIYQDSRSAQLEQVGLDAASIARAITEILDHRQADEETLEEAAEVSAPGVKSVAPAPSTRRG